MVLRSMWGTLVGRMFSVGKAVLMVGISLGALSRAFVALMNNVVGIRRDVLSFFLSVHRHLFQKMNSSAPSHGVSFEATKP
jgi:uncharacterized membrane protein